MTREEAIMILENLRPKDADSRFSACEIGDALNMAIEALEQTRWIPYDDDDDTTWPEDGTWNIFTNGKQLSVERFKVDALNHFFPNGRWFELDDAIAWMPLPQPYKGESEG